MNHVLILMFLTTVLVGTWATLVTWQRYRQLRSSRTRHFFDYVVVFNVMVFGYLIAHYSFTNLIGFNPLAFPHSALVLSVGVFPIEAGLAWTALRLGWALQRRRFPAAISRAFAAGMMAFGISYVVGLTILLRNGGLLWLVRTHMALGLVMSAVLVTVFLILATCHGRELNEEQRRAVHRLGLSLLWGHVALAASATLPNTLHLPVLATTLLWLNCVPLFWLRGDYDSYDQVLVVAADGTAAIAALVKEHDLTRREQEIMELIVRGKSNKEIEAQLCISFSTVKNHAYNLYRKLGVSSRAQLTHLVMTSVGRRVGATARDGSRGFTASRSSP